MHERVPLKFFCCSCRSTSKASNGNAAPSSHCEAHAACASIAKGYPRSPCNIDPVKAILTSLPQAAKDAMKAAAAVSVVDVSPIPGYGYSELVVTGSCSSLKTVVSNMPPKIRRIHFSMSLSNSFAHVIVDSGGVKRS